MDNVLILVGILFIASLILVRSASSLVTAISVIGGYFKLSEFTVAFVLMGIVTSLPEIAVAISSALSGNPNLALGTAIGSNIANLTLIIGIPTLIAGGLEVRSIIARKDALVMFVFGITPLLLLLDGGIDTADAFILLIFYALYLYRLLSQRSYFSTMTNHISKKRAITSLLVFVFNIFIVFCTSYIIVGTSELIAEALFIPIVIVGLVLVSIGTSLPELAHGLTAVKLNHNGQILGDILGSVVANSTLIIAIAALISPIKIVDPQTLIIPVGFLVATLLLFLLFVYTDKRLTIKEILLLIGVYVAFVVTQLGFEIIEKSVGG